MRLTRATLCCINAQNAEPQDAVAKRDAQVQFTEGAALTLVNVKDAVLLVKL